MHWSMAWQGILQSVSSERQSSPIMLTKAITLYFVTAHWHCSKGTWILAVISHIRYVPRAWQVKLRNTVKHLVTAATFSTNRLRAVYACDDSHMLETSVVNRLYMAKWYLRANQGKRPRDDHLCYFFWITWAWAWKLKNSWSLLSTFFFKFCSRSRFTNVFGNAHNLLCAPCLWYCIVTQSGNYST